MKRLKSVENGEVSLEIGECDCGYHFGVDATFLDQVTDFTFQCPSCERWIDTGEIFPLIDLPDRAGTSLPEACECDNTHEQNGTVCRWCWAHGRRKPDDPPVREPVRIAEDAASEQEKIMARTGCNVEIVPNDDISEKFETRVGRPPTQDDLDRVNCKRVGEGGHRQCGWCQEHDKPRFICGCLHNKRS